MLRELRSRAKPSTSTDLGSIIQTARSRPKGGGGGSTVDVFEFSP